MEDRDEEFERRRDLVEYHASFIEPEAVKKIREARSKALEIPEDEFALGLERRFGHVFNAPRKPSGTIESVDPTEAISKYKSSKKFVEKEIDRKGLNYKHWLDSDLEQ